MLKPHYWLPDTTSYGDTPKCDNCRYYGEKNDSKPSGKCGRSGWICGNWEEAEQIQIAWKI